MDSKELTMKIHFRPQSIKSTYKSFNQVAFGNNSILVIQHFTELQAFIVIATNYNVFAKQLPRFPFQNIRESHGGKIELLIGSISNVIL